MLFPGHNRNASVTGSGTSLHQLFQIRPYLQKQSFSHIFPVFDTDLSQESCQAQLFWATPGNPSPLKFLFTLSNSSGILRRSLLSPTLIKSNTTAVCSCHGLQCSTQGNSSSCTPSLSLHMCWRRTPSVDPISFAKKHRGFCCLNLVKVAGQQELLEIDEE